MAQTPEVLPPVFTPGQQETGVGQRPESITEVAPQIGQGGVAASQTQFTTQVTGDNNQPLTQSPTTQNVTITLPTDESHLQEWAHHKPNDSIAWLGRYWLRMLAKAVHFGWHTVIKPVHSAITSALGPQQAQSTQTLSSGSAQSAVTDDQTDYKSVSDDPQNAAVTNNSSYQQDNNGTAQNDQGETT